MGQLPIRHHPIKVKFTKLYTAPTNHSPRYTELFTTRANQNPTLHRVVELEERIEKVLHKIPFAFALSVSKKWLARAKHDLARLPVERAAVYPVALGIVRTDRPSHWHGRSISTGKCESASVTAPASAKIKLLCY